MIFKLATLQIPIFIFFVTVCEAGCDWEGSLSREDFLNVSHGMIQKQINRVDDVKAAFR